MTEQECLAKMKAPGTTRPTAYKGGVIQILVTSSCDKQCYSCTQASNLRRKPWFMTPKQFEQAVLSLNGFHGVYGLFGGNPALHPQFHEICTILEKHVPFAQRGIWCNNPLTLDKAITMRKCFDPSVSNLNVHLDQHAYDLFKQGWPECNPVGLHQDSRHSPPFVAMRDVLNIPCEICDGNGSYSVHSGGPDGNEYVGCDSCDGTGKVYDESQAWELISDCDINQKWSALVGVFRGKLRAWFCEVAGAQAILHQDEPDYPDTGMELEVLWEIERPGSQPAINKKQWWRLPMNCFADQVRKHCHDCGVPLRGHGQLAQSKDPSEQEQTSAAHEAVYHLKNSKRLVQVCTDRLQLGRPLGSVVKYLQNSKA